MITLVALHNILVVLAFIHYVKQPKGEHCDCVVNTTASDERIMY